MRNIFIVALLLTLPPLASAQDQWNWSGFGSLGGGQVSRDNLTFMEYDDDWSFDSDSIIGLHLQGDIAPHWSVTTQIVAQGYHTDTTDRYKPEVDWLFLSYQWSPEVRLRLGRMRTPHYLYSETVGAGYSYPWVRPPNDVYTFFLSPFYNFDGADLTWNGDIGNLGLDVQIFGGSMQGDYAGNDIKAEPVGGTNITLRGEEWLLRYGLVINITDISNPDWKPYEDYYRQIANLTGDNLFNTVADSFSTHDEPYVYHALGAQWDHANWTLLSEAYHIENKGNGFSNTSNGWYASWFYHFEKITPYLTHARYSNTLNKDTIKALESSYERYPAGSLGPDIEALRSGTIAAFTSFHSKQRSWALGTRYDFLAQACIKLEVEYFDFLDGTTGLMIPAEGAKRPKDAILTSFTIDVVF